MAFKLNFENKKQIATFLLAAGLGLLGALLMKIHVETSVKAQTKQLAREYSKNASDAQKVFAKDLELRDRKIRDVMKKMEARQKAQMEKVAKQAAAAAAASASQGGARAAAAGTATRVVENTRFSLLTPPGKRALTIVIDSLSAVGGLISAGDYVDILADLKVSKESPTKGDITTILFQNVQVLAVGANFNPQSNVAIYQQQQSSRSLNVTLSVDPEEVGLVAFAQKFGSLRLALRSPSEKNVESVAVAEWDSLSDYVLDRQGTELDVPKRRKEAPKKPNYKPKMEEEDVGSFVEIFRGGQTF